MASPAREAVPRRAARPDPRHRADPYDVPPARRPWIEPVSEEPREAWCGRCAAAGDDRPAHHEAGSCPLSDEAMEALVEP